MLATLVFAIVLVGTQHDYGETWDEYEYYQIGASHYQYLFGNGQEPSTYRDLRRYYGPFSCIVASALRVYLHDKTSLMTGEAAAHFHLILLFAISGLVMFLVILADSGGLAAGLCLVVYFSFPRLLGHSHNNMGDFPVTAWIVLAVFTFHAALRTRSYVGMACAGVLTGAALATKIQAGLVAPLLLLYVLAFLAVPAASGESVRTRLRFVVVGCGLVYWLTAFSLMIVLWPWLWPAPVSRFVEALQAFNRFPWHNAVLYRGEFVSASGIPRDYAPFYVLITTPLVWLPFAALGFVRAGSDVRKGHLLPMLVAVGFLVPIGVEVFSSTPIYDGVRHFLPAFPFLACLVGYGMEWTIRLAKRTRVQRTAAAALVGAAIVSVIVQDVRIHPYQTTYFNALVGGGRGAMGRFELDYWGNSLKEAGRYVNEHAPAGSKVHVVRGLERLAKLRPDLVVTDTAPDYAIVLSRESLFPNPYKDQSPIYVVEADGAVLSRVYRLPAEQPHS